MWHSYYCFSAIKKGLRGSDVTNPQGVYLFTLFLFRFVCFFPFNSSENILFYIFSWFYETRTLSIIWRRSKAPTPILLFYFLSTILMGWNLTLDTRGTLIKKKKSSKTRLDWKQTVHKLITRRTSLFMCTLLYIEIIGVKNWPPLTIELRTEKEWIRNVDILPEYLNSPSVVIGFMLPSLSFLCSICRLLYVFLFFGPFSFGHYVACPSSVYGFMVSSSNHFQSRRVKLFWKCVKIS